MRSLSAPTERGNDREFAELRVRSETGRGAEKGGVADGAPTPEKSAQVPGP